MCVIRRRIDGPYGIVPPFLFFYFVIKEGFIKTIPKILTSYPKTLKNGVYSIENANNRGFGISSRYSHLPVNPYFIPFLLKKIFLDRLSTQGLFFSSGTL
jgi:hypothetical protein